MLLKRYYKPSDYRVNPLWRVQNEFDQLFGKDAFGGLLAEGKSEWSPSLDVVEEKNQYLAKLELAGVKPEDVKVTFEDGVLTVKGERKEEKSADENRVHISERYYGSFERSIRFPNPVDQDKVVAKFNDGVLQVTLPKTEEAKPRQIEISAE